MSEMPACDKCGQWPQPSLAVDAVTIFEDKVLLITRGREPWKGSLAFPGGFIEKGEDPEDAVLRDLKEETGLDGKIVDLLCVRGNPERDPRGHIISIAYVIAATGEPNAGDDAAHAAWYPISEVTEMAGDHLSILEQVK